MPAIRPLLPPRDGNRAQLLWRKRTSGLPHADSKPQDQSLLHKCQRIQWLCREVFHCFYTNESFRARIVEGRRKVPTYWLRICALKACISLDKQSEGKIFGRIVPTLADLCVVRAGQGSSTAIDHGGGQRSPQRPWDYGFVDPVVAASPLRDAHPERGD